MRGSAAARPVQMKSRRIGNFCIYLCFLCFFYSAIVDLSFILA
jgi:hypothetical protein